MEVANLFAYRRIWGAPHSAYLAFEQQIGEVRKLVDTEIYILQIVRNIKSLNLTIPLTCLVNLPVLARLIFFKEDYYPISATHLKIMAGKTGNRGQLTHLP